MIRTSGPRLHLRSMANVFGLASLVDEYAGQRKTTVFPGSLSNLTWRS